jgi:hypothetical protein
MTENNSLRYFVEVWKHTSIYSDNEVQNAAVVFAPIILEIIDYIYVQDTRKLYDKLYEIEQKHIPSGLELAEKKSRKEYIDYDTDIKNALRNINWDSVLLEIINNIDEYKNVLDNEAYVFLLSKKNIIDKIDSVSKQEITTEQKNRRAAAFLKLNKYIKHNYWIQHIYKNHWNGSFYDILKSPLFSLIRINYETSKYIKEISDILYTADNRGSPPQHSILIRARECQKIFDKYGSELMNLILKNIDNNIRYNYLINKKLIEYGVSPSERYILNHAFYWMIRCGCLKDINKDKDGDIKAELLNVYTNLIYPSGSKMLLTYPLAIK